MNVGDKITWGYRSLFILMLVWLRFIEQYIPSWGILVAWAVIMFFILFQPFSRKKREKNLASNKQAPIP